MRDSPKARLNCALKWERDSPCRRHHGITDRPVTAMAVTRCDGRDGTDTRDPPYLHGCLLELERSDDHSDELFALLNKAQNDGSLARWWPGSHGRRGEIYPGETDTYGDLWELSYKDWHSSSELALALVKADPDNPLSQERQGQWNSRAHLHANRLGWSCGDEVRIRAR
jgi:hypothetical protein